MRTTILISVRTIFVSACSTTQKITPTLRTATEQLLLTESVLRSLPRDRDMPFPIPRGSKVKLEVSSVSPDKDLVKSVVAGWMGMHGYLPQDENASHRINIVVNSLGTEYATTFFGIPPINVSLIPIATPELAFYKSESQLGYSRALYREKSHGRLLVRLLTACSRQDRLCVPLISSDSSEFSSLSHSPRPLRALRPL